MKLLTHNVKDLFDVGHVLSPKFPEHVVTEAHLTEKIAALIALYEGIAPDVIALQEIGSERLLSVLAERLQFPHVVCGEPDERGIRCAILSRIAVLGSGSWRTDSLQLPNFVPGSPQLLAHLPQKRAAVHASIATSDGPLHVVSVHLKSNLPMFIGEPVARGARSGLDLAEADARSSFVRAAEALFIRKKLDELFVEKKRANVAVLGDFNDVPGSLTLRIFSGGDTRRTDLTQPMLLIPVLDRLASDSRYSILSRGTRMQLDHALLSSNIANRVRGAVIHNTQLRDHDLFPPGSLLADSDHAAVEIDLELTSGGA